MKLPGAAGACLVVALSGCAPCQAPLAVQAVAFAEDHVRDSGWPANTLAGLAVRVTVGEAWTVTLAELAPLAPAPVHDME